MKNELIKNDWRWKEIQEVEKSYIAGIDPYSTDSASDSVMIFKKTGSVLELMTPDIARMKRVFIGSCFSIERLN